LSTKRTIVTLGFDLERLKDTIRAQNLFRKV
jgi:hypothetical protein